MHAQLRSFKNLGPSASTLSGLAHFDPITVSLDNTLEDVADLFLKNRIHRVFVIDSQGKPTHVISIDDLIKALK